MLHFRDYHWLTVQSSTRIDALISTDNKNTDDVCWMLDVQCVAGGAAWRRVEPGDRPSLWLEISSFKPKLRHWTDLEHLNFWSFAEEEDEEAWFGPGGLLDVEFYPRCGEKGRESSFLSDFVWRVAGREGGWFIVELAAMANGLSLRDQLAAREVKVTPDGSEVPAEPDAEFWKKHATLYLMENIPFGTISVRVPRNVRDPEAYALHRARTLAGVDEPEHIIVTDHLRSSQRHKTECPEIIRDDIYVELHFNGFYED